MTIDDAPMDELDLAIRREAAVLRSDLISMTDTDSAWDDFLAASTAPVVQLDRTSFVRRSRWRIAIAVGMVAALIVTVVIVRQFLDGDPTNLPTITPAPPTTALAVSPTTAPTTDTTAATATTARLAPTVDTLNTDGSLAPPLNPPYLAVTLEGRSDLVAVGIDGKGRKVATIPPSNAGQYVKVDLSSAGWVAETGLASEGFWFYNLNDPEGTRRFVALAGQNGGHTSRGTWNPAGTLYAAVELDTTAVVIDPEIGAITRLPSTVPPVGYPPTWTSRGDGILIGRPASACLGLGDVTGRSLSIVPIPELTDASAIGKELLIGTLADGFNRVTTNGVWANDDLCDTPPADGSQPALTDVAVVDLAGSSTPWISADEVAPSVLRNSVFASTRQDLWVVAERGPGDRTVQLYRVTGPHQYRVINALPAAVASGSYVMIAGVAPDDSAVVVLANGPSDRRRFYLMPTDGSPPTTLDGEFAGFVPTTLIDFLR